MRREGVPRQGQPVPMHRPALLSVGVPSDSAFVHDEIRELATEAKQLVAKNASRHATSRSQVVAGVLQFGPSGQSRVMLEREHEAAVHSEATGVYAVWRSFPDLSSFSNTSSSRDESDCCRVGPSHRCVCTHLLAEHQQPKKVAPRRGGGTINNPPCAACGCKGFSYVPNEPEEVGDHWITRRKGYVAGSWFPKCRCGHGTNEHDSASLKCRTCARCFRMEPHFSCLVCNRPATAHQTIFETAEDRASAGRTVGAAYFPFANDAQLSELMGFKKER